MTRRQISVGAAALALLAAPACHGDRARDEARAVARRNSCIAAELALSAKERLASLDTMVANAQGTPLAQTAEASRAFAALYRAHADAASQAADLADSAAWASSRDDSARYARLAARARPAAPAPGSAAENAGRQYDEDVTRALGNPDHPCNKPKDDES